MAANPVARFCRMQRRPHVVDQVDAVHGVGQHVRVAEIADDDVRDTEGA
jgi:hypothetical protein